MIKVSDSDLYSLNDFPLKWRWTDERWNLLPLESVQQINPLVETKAQEIWKIHNKHLSSDGFDAELIEQEEMIRTELVDFSIVKEWLKTRIVNQSPKVLISWHKDLAVQTTSEIFCDYWNDFCYPASDDITVSPNDLSWLLFYHHEEYLFFGKVKKEFI